MFTSNTVLQIFHDNNSILHYMEDDADITLTFKTGIEDNNNTTLTKKIEVHTSNNPIVALSKFKPNFYDLVLIDINMSYIDGFQLSEKILDIDLNVKICYMSSGEINRDALREIHPPNPSGFPPSIPSQQQQQLQPTCPNGEKPNSSDKCPPQSSTATPKGHTKDFA